MLHLRLQKKIVIKVFLKHYIYEKCIDVLFNTIINNFCTKPTKTTFKAGDRLSFIKIQDPMHGVDLYEDVTIGHVNYDENNSFIFSGIFKGRYHGGYFYPNVSERKHEYVNSFPRHPDYRIIEYKKCIK